MALMSGKYFSVPVRKWLVLMLALRATRVRQLKRWTDKWGFFRNVPDGDMAKMVRKRKRREQQLGRPTKFMRKLGAGEFQQVPATKLDTYQKRAGTRLASPLSQSSGQSHKPQIAQGPSF
jgi:hypothetical protein